MASNPRVQSDQPGAAGPLHPDHFGFRLAGEAAVRAARERFRTAGITEIEWQDDGRFVRVQVVMTLW